jgi:hypothetical protein
VSWAVCWLQTRSVGEIIAAVLVVEIDSEAVGHFFLVEAGLLGLKAPTFNFRSVPESVK